MPLLVLFSIKCAGFCVLCIMGKHNYTPISALVQIKAINFIFKFGFVVENSNPEMNSWLAICLYWRCFCLIRDWSDNAANLDTHMHTRPGPQTCCGVQNYECDWEDSHWQKDRGSTARLQHLHQIFWVKVKSFMPLIKTMETSRGNLGSRKSVTDA